jgi:hypothetical protein
MFFVARRDAANGVMAECDAAGSLRGVGGFRRQQGGGDAKALAVELSNHLQRLSVLVSKLLALPDASISEMLP